MRDSNTKQSKQTEKRWVWGLVGAGLIVGVGWIWWICEKDGGTPFLARRGATEWIVYPQAFDAIMHDAASLRAEFRRSFKLSATSAKALLELRGFRSGEVKINGERVDSPDVGGYEDWKKVCSADVSKFLRAGENEIVVIVTNSLGPPAMWLRLDLGGSVIASDKDWEVSVIDGAWEKAAFASDAPRIRPGNYLYGQGTTSDSVKRRWPSVIAMVVISVLAVVGGGLARRIGRGRQGVERMEPPDVKAASASHMHWEHEPQQCPPPYVGGYKVYEKGPEIVLVVIAVVWIVLFWNNIREMPSLVGFDREGHLQYIDYILQKHRLPLADEGWQLYQPPLYYLLSALGIGAFHLAATADAAVMGLRAFSGMIGLAQVVLIFLCLRRLFPGQAMQQTVGLLVGAFLPANIYISHQVTNEPLAALFVTAAIYFCVRIIKTSDLPVNESKESREEQGERGRGPAFARKLLRGRPAFARELRRGRRGWEYVSVGICLGLAMLTKFSALLAIPPICAALLWDGLRKQMVERSRNGTARSLKETVETVQSKMGEADTPLKRGVNERGRMLLISAIRNVLVVLMAGVLVCGWHYVRVWHHFGKPLVGNWDASLSLRWWQEPGYHTSAWCWHFGESFVTPLFSSVFSFSDGIYSTLWGDGLCSGMAGVLLRPPWNYDLMNIGYLIALVPTILIVAGIFVAVVRFLRQPSAEMCLMLGLLFAFAFGIVLMSLRVASYAQVKAIYGLPAIVALCWAAVTGWNCMVAGKRLLGWLGGVGLSSWVITICCAFWINSRSAVTVAMRGLNLAAQERFEEAVQEYSRALKLDANYLPARDGLADALAHAGHVENAVREAELTIQQHPENAEAQFRLGASLALNGQNREASGHLQQAIALAPEHPGFHQELSLCYSRMKMYREAASACRDGLRRYPLNFDLLNNLAWLLATNPEATLRNGNRAVLLAERACQLTSYRKPIYIGTLAAAYAEEGRFDDAIVAGEKARQLCLAAGQKELADRNGKMLELYRAGLPFHEGSDK